MTIYIYALSDPSTGDVRYIGQSHDLVDRIREHLSCGPVGSWVMSLGSLPDVKILEERESREEAIVREEELISEYSKCFDLINIHGRSVASVGSMGWRIRKLRASRDLSRPKLARKSGVGVLSIIAVESGKQKSVSSSNTSKLARALGTTVEYLVTGESTTPQT